MGHGRLYAPDEMLAADIGRRDTEETLMVRTYREIPIQVFDAFYRDALERLDPFESGLTFTEAGIVSER